MSGDKAINTYVFIVMPFALTISSEEILTPKSSRRLLPTHTHTKTAQWHGNRFLKIIMSRFIITCERQNINLGKLQ